MSIVPPSNIPISVDYTGRDYYAIRSELIARIQDRLPNWTATNPADFGVALVEAFAYMGDLMSYYIDRNINESFISSATQRDSVINIAQTYGYIPTGYYSATISLQFENSSDTDIITIPAGTVLSADVTVGDTVNTLYFTTDGDVVLDPAFDGGLGTITAREGRSVTLVSDYANTYGELVGQSDGTPNQVFELGETPVVDGSLEVYVQDGDSYSKWVQVQHLIDYNPYDQVFTVINDSNNNVFVNFGDGISGLIPLNSSEIRVLYTVGGGILGNIPIGTIDTTNSKGAIEYVPGLTTNDLIALQALVTVANTSTGIGGSDPESLPQIRYSAPLTLRANTRAVTLEDFRSLALGANNCGKAKATADIWTSVTLYVAPVRNSGDTDQQPGLDESNNPTIEYTQLESDVTSALSSRMLIGSSLTVQPPVYSDIILTVQYAKYPQYTTTEVETAIKSVLTTSFGYVNMDFGQTIYPQDVETALNTSARGVKIAKLSAFHRVGDTGTNVLEGSAEEIFRIKEDNISIITL